MSVRFKSPEEQVKFLERRVAELVMANIELTAALTELVEVTWEAIPFVGFEGYLPERTEQLRYRVNAARAVLSATPTESEAPSRMDDAGWNYAQGDGTL